MPFPTSLQVQQQLDALAERRAAVEAERRAGEAAHEEVVQQSAIRAEPLGCDRDDRHYWWRPSASPTLQPPTSPAPAAPS